MKVENVTIKYRKKSGVLYYEVFHNNNYLFCGDVYFNYCFRNMKVKAEYEIGNILQYYKNGKSIYQ